MKISRYPAIFALALLTIFLCSLRVGAQLNCSGGPLNCPGTPTGTGVVVLQVAPTITGAANLSGAVNFSGVNQMLQLSGHNFVQGDATFSYFYGGTSGVQIRKSDNSTAWFTLDDSGIAVFPGATVTVGVTSTITIGTAKLQMRGNAVLLDGTPTCSGGGCVVLANSINSAGSVSTTTTGAADITITFSASFQHAPVCLGDNATTGNLLRATQEAVGSFHLQGVTASGDTLGYVCIGN